MSRFLFSLVTKTVPSNETLGSCIDLCHNSERCQERLERFFFPSGILTQKNKFSFVEKFFSEQFIGLLPNLFKHLTPLYILTNLFTSLFDLLLTLIDNDQSAKIFAAKCGAIADERLVCKNSNFCLINLFFNSCKTFVNNLIDDSIWEADKVKKTSRFC